MAASRWPLIPVFRSPPVDSQFDAGVYHGRTARNQIHAWSRDTEMVALLQFIESDTGRCAFIRLKADNVLAFPEFASNIKGIAQGSGIQVPSYGWLSSSAETHSMRRRTLCGR